MQFRIDREGNYLLKNGGKYNARKGNFRIYPADSLIPDKNGEYFRQWRPHIKRPVDIWNEIVKVTNIPGLTSAPKLQPIETRLIMLSTGMRAPMGLKVYGPDLQSIEQGGMLFEQALKEVPAVKTSAVFYDRAVGAPYIEIKLNREAMARYGMSVSDVQEILQVAVGGMSMSTSVEGRERFPMRVHYARELPIYRKKYIAMQKEANLLKNAISQNYTASANTLKTEYYKAIQLYQDAQRRMALYGRQSMLAGKSLDITIKSFSVSGSGLADLLRIRQQTLDYDYKQVEAVADYNTAIAWLKRLMAFQQF